MVFPRNSLVGHNKKNAINEVLDSSKYYTFYRGHLIANNARTLAGSTIFDCDLRATLCTGVIGRRSAINKHGPQGQKSIFDIYYHFLYTYTHTYFFNFKTLRCFRTSIPTIILYYITFIRDGRTRRRQSIGRRQIKRSAATAAAAVFYIITL